jgi:Na+/H+-translocating membrane pyrophosphatase
LLLPLFLSIFSALAGNMGMKIQKRMLELPSRTYEFASSLKSFFGGGTVMGVAGLAVLGLTFIFFFHFL